MNHETETTLVRTGGVPNILLILLACLVTYLNAVQAGFLALDDIGMLNLLHAPDFSASKLFSLYDNRYFRPLGFATLLVDIRMFGPNPGMFHLVNILIHVSNALLVYYLTRELIGDRPDKDRPALIAALLFALHPANAEAVAWIGARFDLLCAFFFLLALILLVKRGSSATPLTLVCFGLAIAGALLSKEASLCILMITPLYLVLERKSVPREKAVLLTATVLLGALAYFCLRHVCARAVDNGLRKLISTDKSMLTICRDTVTTYGFYLQKMVYPLPLSFTIATIDKTKSLLFFLVSVPVIAIICRRFRDTRLPVLIMLTALVLPITAMVGNLSWVPYAERYLYLPSIGFSIMIALLFAHCSKRIPYALVLAGTLLIAVPTVQRVNLWADPVAFWQDTVTKSPEFATPRLFLAAEFIGEGKTEEARHQLQNALEIGLNREIDRQFAMKILEHLNSAAGAS